MAESPRSRAPVWWASHSSSAPLRYRRSSGVYVRLAPIDVTEDALDWLLGLGGSKVWPRMWDGIANTHFVEQLLTRGTQVNSSTLWLVWTGRRTVWLSFLPVSLTVRLILVFFVGCDTREESRTVRLSSWSFGQLCVFERAAVGNSRWLLVTDGLGFGGWLLKPDPGSEFL